jgi:hypothetical protein
MIHSFLQADFENPPVELSFELRYSELLAEIQRAAQVCLDVPRSDAAFATAALRLYIMTQAMPSVLLNYKICIEFGLPLHPTEYIDFARAEKNPEAYRPSTREAALELFIESIDLAQSVYRLDSACAVRLGGLRRRIPEFLNDFVYTNTPDKYTWRASEPASVEKLAAEVRASGFAADLVIGAAHGSIRPAILLANLLHTQLYLLRYSLFKRSDSEPIISAGDRDYLARFRDKRVMIFDEDVAKGQTLRAFAERLAPEFGESRTAAVLCHYLAPYTPSFVGQTLYD